VVSRHFYAWLFYDTTPLVFFQEVDFEAFDRAINEDHLPVPQARRNFWQFVLI